jgi:hypothetical protein
MVVRDEEYAACQGKGGRDKEKITPMSNLVKGSMG